MVCVHLTHHIDSNQAGKNAKPPSNNESHPVSRRIVTTAIQRCIAIHALKTIKDKRRRKDSLRRNVRQIRCSCWRKQEQQHAGRSNGNQYGSGIHRPSFWRSCEDQKRTRNGDGNQKAQGRWHERKPVGAPPDLFASKTENRPERYALHMQPPDGQGDPIIKRAACAEAPPN